MTPKEEKVADAAVRILRKAGGQLTWNQLYNKLEGHLILQPSRQDIGAAIAGLVRSQRVLYIEGGLLKLFEN